MLKKINFSNKKGKFNPERRNHPDTINIREQKACLMANIYAEDYIVIYLDETAVDETLVPRSGYEEIGTPFVVRLHPKTERSSLLAAITKN